MHTLTTRQPTPDEQRVMVSRGKPDFASFGCLLVFAAGPAFFLGDLGHWLGDHISPAAAQYGRWLGWAIPVAVVTPLAISVIRFGQRQRKLAQSDMRGQIVQDIHVTNPRVIEVAMVGNTGPNLAIELAEDLTLYLQGQWLNDNLLYGAPSPESDDGDERFNGLPSPHSFPATEFTISRLPNSGEVIQIRVAGQYLQPEPPVAALKQHHQFQSSELFSGSITDIEKIMEREHVSRHAS